MINQHASWHSGGGWPLVGDTLKQSFPSEPTSELHSYMFSVYISLGWSSKTSAAKKMLLWFHAHKWFLQLYFLHWVKIFHGIFFSQTKQSNNRLIWISKCAIFVAGIQHLWIDLHLVFQSYRIFYLSVWQKCISQIMTWCSSVSLNTPL